MGTSFSFAVILRDFLLGHTQEIRTPSHAVNRASSALETYRCTNLCLPVSKVVQSYVETACT